MCSYMEKSVADVTILEDKKILKVKAILIEIVRHFTSRYSDYN